MWDRALKERYGSAELQPDDGWTIVRSKRPEALLSTVLDDVGMATDVDDASDDDGVDDDALARKVSSLEFLCSIALPLNPPATPAIIISSSAMSRSKSQRLAVPR